MEKYEFGYRRNTKKIEKEWEYNGITYKFDRAFGYNKALVYVDGKNEILVSYTTVVATYIDGKIKINGWYSTTTATHINEFLYQHGFNSMTKKEMEAA